MRIDKYDPKSGGFRAPLAANQASTPGQVGDADAAIGVGLDVNGRVVPGAGNTGIKAVLVLTRALNAGEISDNMTDGEVVEFGGVAGTNYYANPADGTISSNPDAGGVGTGVYLGHTVEADRLIVRVER